MIQSLPEGIPYIYFHGINLYFALAIAFLIILLGIILIVKQKAGEISEYFVKIKKAYGRFMIFYGICRIFFILGVLYPNQLTIGGNLIENGYKFFILIGYLLFAAGLLSILIVLEGNIVTKSKHFFSIISVVSLVIGAIGLIFTILGIDVAINFSDIITYDLAPIMIGLIALIYLVILIKGSSDIRKQAFIIILAMIFLMAGALLDSEGMVISAVERFNGNELYIDLFYCVPPLVSFIGTIMFAWVNLRNNQVAETKKKSGNSVRFFKVLHFISAFLFSAVVFVLLLMFGGEFLVIADNKWLLLIFAILIISNAIYFVTPIREKISNKTNDQSDKTKKYNPKWILGTAIWNVIMGLGVAGLYVVLLFLTLGMFSGVLSIIYVAVAIPMLGFSALFFIHSVKALRWYREQDSQPKSESLEKMLQVGMIPAGLIFLLTFSAFAIAISNYDPAWGEGVDHISLFTAGEEGRDYRIPSLMVLPGNIILAFAESRFNAMSDWGDIDLVMKRSIDGGTTWSNIISLVDAGDNTAGNQCPVFDNDTQTVWLPFCINNQKVLIMNSTDYGVTWSTPVEITSQLQLDITAKEGQIDMIYGTGPGIGIQLAHAGALNGRLVVPCYYFAGRGAHVIYSDDHGLSWHKGENVEEASSEPQVFENVDGRVCLNIRNDAGGYRYVAWSDDGGATFSPATLDEGLMDAACMASLIRYSETPAQSRNRVLFSNPAQMSRGHMTVRLSYDEATTWEIAREVYAGPSAYSQLAVLSDGTICLLFEQGRYDYRESIQFCRFSLEWLTNGQETTY